MLNLIYAILFVYDIFLFFFFGSFSLDWISVTSSSLMIERYAPFPSNLLINIFELVFFTSVENLSTTL